MNCIFHLHAHSDIFLKSSLSTFIEIVVWLTVTNSKVLSGKVLSWYHDAKLSDRSLIEMRKNNGPSIDPWGAPTLTGNQSDA